MDSSTAEFTRQWTAAQAKVAAFIGSMVFDISDRDDLLQDCAVAAMTSYSRYDPARPFSAWIIGVARNQIRLYLRRKSNEPHLFDEETLDSLVTAFSRIRPEQEQKLNHLDRCIDHLDSRARHLCELRYTHNLKPAAIAKQLNITPNTAAKSLQRIREQLRACLEKTALSPS